jgi:hypothetical protein
LRAAWTDRASDLLLSSASTFPSYSVDEMEEML